MKSFKYPKIIAVSKTFKIDHIKPLIDHGHLDYGENKVQEAIEKWTEVKNDNKDIKLHLIGRLQSNKVKLAVKIFDYIHSLDSIKLASKISEEQKKIKRNIKIFIQINIGREEQKTGILLEDLKNFYRTCTENLDLNIIGLMCLPPNKVDPSEYFEQMNNASSELGLNHLSIGMSSDYLIALKFNPTFLRIGSKIFGERS